MIGLVSILQNIIYIQYYKDERRNDKIDGNIIVMIH